MPAVATAIVQRADLHTKLHSPEWLPLNVSAPFALLVQQLAGTAVDAADWGVVTVACHTQSPYVFWHSWFDKQDESTP
jgi:phage terminase small subunit